MSLKLRHMLHIAGSQGADLLVGSLALLCALAGWLVEVVSTLFGRLTGCFSSRLTRRLRHMAMVSHRHVSGRALPGLALCFALLLGSDPAAAATAPGTVIPNTADLTYEIGGVAQPILPSNTVYVTLREQAAIEFMQYAPTAPGATTYNVPPTLYRNTSGSYVPLPSGPLPPAQTNPVPLIPADSYRIGEPIYILLTDRDQNQNPTIQETIDLVITSGTGDMEWLRLTETAPGSGQFAGYILSTSLANGNNSADLTVAIDTSINVTYTDPLDDTPTVVDLALVDPFGIVFDTATGQPVNGAEVTLFDINTNAPANVLGDDLVAGYPATVTSGQDVLHNGNTYTVPPGGFRFPYVLPGDYRLIITPPAGYANHSTTLDFPTLQLLPGGPFALSDASIGQPFVVNPGPAVHIDIPIDPAVTGLWMQKSVNHSKATVGDFLQYKLTVQNLSVAATAVDVMVTDNLPLAFRYQTGSARQDGLTALEPSISPDGRQLQFAVGNIAAGQQVEITYVVEVVAGAQPGDAINRAQAADTTGATSNIASALVEIQPLFFNHEAFLVGRVLNGSCDQDDTAMAGVSGVRIYLEDGSYIITDENGRYHFEGVEPGVHVVQVDTTSLPAGYEMLPCEQTSQTAGRTFSQFVDLQGGTLWRVNFYTAPEPPPTGDISLQMTSELDGDDATFHVDITTKAVATDNLRLTVMLPGNSAYLDGTASRDGNVLDAPQTMPGVVTIRTSTLNADSTTRLSFKARLDASDASGALPAKAMLMFDTPSANNQRTPLVETSFKLDQDMSVESREIKLYPHYPSFVADLQETDKTMLSQLVTELKGQNIARVDLVGHTDNQQIAARSRHIFADNRALSIARAQGVATFLRQHLQIADENISIRGLGDSMPTADNTTASGRALNRRVELYLVTETSRQTNQIAIDRAVSDKGSVKTTGASPAEMKRHKVPQPQSVPLVAPPVIDDQWLLNATEDVELVWPAPGYVPEFPSLKVLLKHKRGDRPVLLLNGQEVSGLNLDTTHSHPRSPVSVISWFGLDLKRGQNLLEAAVTNADGQLVANVSREIWYVSDPANASLVTEHSRLVADGVEPPVIAVRLTDRNGHPIRPGQTGEYLVDPPFQPLLEKELDGKQPASSPADKTEYVVAANGTALLYLEPTTQTGQVTVRLPYGQETLELSAWLKPAPREWILVGFAEGTVGYNDLSGHMVSLDQADIDEHAYQDGRVKFFAKGAIKGDWLLTMAYDSDKPDRDGDSLQQLIDPDTYYPVYGDGTNQQYEAASARDLYIKLEREQFYAMFGDIETGLTETELTRYSRSFNGFKSELESEHFSYTLFATDTKQAFHKDEIRGDGTSGLYYLSQKDLVLNSETIVIETRGRFHSQTILESRTLHRHVDYEIDYDSGSLFFKQPVPSKDAEFNPIFIIARYETRNSDETHFNYGGRAAVKIFDGKVEVGGTFVHEDAGAEEGNLYGADVTVKVNHTTEVRLEAARTDTKAFGASAHGDAYLAEVEHNSEKLQANAYYREQQPEFGLGQQNGSETGTRKYGADASYRVTPKFSLGALAYHEDNLGTGGARDVAEIDGRYQSGRFGLHSGLREARDRLGDGETQRSSQWLIGGNWLSADRKTNLRADYEQSLRSSDENSDYPTLLTLGADYQLSSNLAFYTEQEFSWGDQEDTEGTRAGFKATPWEGGTINTGVEQRIDENGRRVFALFGLGQSWQLNQHWSVDLSLDRSHTIAHPGNDSFNTNVPPAHGDNEDFTALSLGATYKVEKWSWWNRLETRHAESEDKYGISSGLVGQVRDGVALSAKLMAFITDSARGTRTSEQEIRFGMAYRPDRSRWLILQRLDLNLEREENKNASGYNNWRVVNHLHANYRASRKWQLSFYYGLKYVREHISGQNFSGFTDLIAFETRYQLNKKWDVGLHGSVLHSWNDHQFRYSAGASVGYSMMTNAWVSLGYNLVGFEDQDFDAANYTAQGPFMRFRMKFDQQSVKDAAAWLNR